MGKRCRAKNAKGAKWTREGHFFLRRLRGLRATRSISEAGKGKACLAKNPCSCANGSREAAWELTGTGGRTGESPGNPGERRRNPGERPAARGKGLGFEGNGLGMRGRIPGFRGNVPGIRGNALGIDGNDLGFPGKGAGIRGNAPGQRGNGWGVGGNEPGAMTGVQATGANGSDDAKLQWGKLGPLCRVKSTHRKPSCLSRGHKPDETQRNMPYIICQISNRNWRVIERFKKPRRHSSNGEHRRPACVRPGPRGRTGACPRA